MGDRHPIRHALLILHFVALGFLLTVPAEGRVVSLSVVKSSQFDPVNGGTCETVVQVSSMDSVIGAYLISVHFDSSVLIINEISAPPQSEFYGNTFADKASFSSGTTDITAFQVANQDEPFNPESFIIIKWTILGEAGTFSNIELDVKTMIDFFWRPVVIETTGLFIPVYGDADGDLLSDNFENIPGSCTDPFDADTDDDGLSDGVEDADKDGMVGSNETNPCKPDTDDDGIQDGTESGVAVPISDPDGAGPLLGTDTSVYQPDLDPSTTTNPVVSDSDNDSWLDGQEDFNHNGQIDAGESDPNNNSSIPELKVSTTSITSITSNSAISGGNVISNGGFEITAKGVCWCPDPDTEPTINDPNTVDGTTIGSFATTITGLSESTTYHVRAYAQNSVGIGYGDTLSFATPTVSGCPDCSSDIIIIRDMVINNNSDCECNAATSITFGPNVTVKQGARVRLNSPKVNFKDDVNIESGADFITSQ